MDGLLIPDGYRPNLNLRDTEIAIKQVKDFFQQILSAELNLHRVTAPLFVDPATGMNDNLTGSEEAVSFDVHTTDQHLEIVHSLAKWKRYALKKYGFFNGEGIYTDMNAIRRDEHTDNIHSIYVDQWDWEKIIDRDDRNLPYFESVVKKVYDAIHLTELYMSNLYDYIKTTLPENISFITTADLEEKYPDLTPHEREYEYTRLKGAVCIEKIGWPLKSGEPHEYRAPDYDDWNLNGDILVYDPIIDTALELSSMGIRVDAFSLMKQLEARNLREKADLPFQKAILDEELPFTIGGGIGQSRICMFYLRKAHIGEVQASVWPDEIIKEAEERGIPIL